MQERVKTSFIPKASLNVERARAPRKGSMGLVNLIAILILIVALVGAVGVFLFEQYTVQSIANKKASLERARAAFEPATIKELSRINSRLMIGQQLLDAHIGFSGLFSEIETLTLKNVRFGDFTLDESAPGSTKVSMKGTAASFNALAQQADVFGKSRILQESVFSDFNVDEFGAVIFAYSATVNTGELGYRTPTASPTTPEPIQQTLPTEEPAATDTAPTQPEPVTPTP